MGRRQTSRMRFGEGQVEARAEADWIAEPPKVIRSHRTSNPELTWTVLLHSRPIELPSRTYHEVEVRGDGLVYPSRVDLLATA
jgi:hypothetical protein